jgi:hypothetical protein
LLTYSEAKTKHITEQFPHRRKSKKKGKSKKKTTTFKPLSVNNKAFKEVSKSLVNNRPTEDASQPTKETIDTTTTTSAKEPNITTTSTSATLEDTPTCDKPNINIDNICDTNADRFSPMESDQIKPADVKSSGNMEPHQGGKY